MPGAGKSALAQWLTQILTEQGHAARWWYEEELGHPVYLFHDVASLRGVLDALTAGRHAQVIADALAQWQRFTQRHAQRPGWLVLDGCLFGYLAWTLFAFDIAPATIVAYVERVAAILRPLAPALIGCVQQDVGHTVARLRASRGEAQLAQYIQRVEDSRYGQRQGLRGVDGLVAYWSAYQQVMTTARAGLDLDQTTIDTSTEAWATARQAVLRRLGLVADAAAAAVPGEARALDGVYAPVTPDGRPPCQVERGARGLTISGVPHTWPHTPLLARSDGLYAMEALPFTLRFDEDRDAALMRLTVAGPDLLSGVVAGAYHRRRPSATP